ncbi:class Ia ribonucleoside-diphosphate reductase subunit beta [uncultured Umboniibacter sp.]|uniref:class Ia ribonucleoside-diphosphate reductase subunit beta n=1 Tax=uncultured Umboniibacter sp. TaxID=1798917 RepID=UPI00260A1015|nr:class Ia ribonucleoside-diphosphate reductase subunit beta [uncultured Umboniibacter sp.]
MNYTSFNKKKFDAFSQPMFLGENVNVARYDQQRYPMFERLIEKQLSFFWRPEEIDVSKDSKDFSKLPDHERHIFLSNLKYQTLLDSIQGRSPNVVLLPLVSLPELETWIETWAFSETIHSRSYTHIIRNIMPDPSVIFDDIVDNEAIISRANSVTDYYDDLLEYSQVYLHHGEGTHTLNGKEVTISKRELKKKIFLTIVSVNVLEAIRFYCSFACSFAFAERAIMEGNAKIIRLIARDEALHLSGTQFMINQMANGADDPEFAEIALETRNEVIAIFREAAEQEMEWADYLFKDGSMIGLNKDILVQYIEFITDSRLRDVGYPELYGRSSNPLPWMDSWLRSDSVQVAPQETEITSYLVGAIDSKVDIDSFADMEL